LRFLNNMEPTIIEIEWQIDTLRNCIPTNKDLDEAKVLLCRAQNLMQKHIEKAYPPSEWQHTRTIAPTQSVYNQYPVGEE